MSSAPIAPNLDAFTAGIEVEIFVVLFTIGALLIVNWVVRIMGSSN
jgi:hypothetical protein